MMSLKERLVATAASFSIKTFLVLYKDSPKKWELQYSKKLIFWLVKLFKICYMLGQAQEIS